MKRTYITIFLVLVTLSTKRCYAQVSDSLVLALMDQYDVPGLSLAIVHRDSSSTFSWGYADSDRTIGVTADTPFRIASVSKVLVAATILTEVSKGAISLEDDISTVIPLHGRFSGPITLHDLLTHTAGFDERLIAYGARSADEMRPLGEYLVDRMPLRGWPVGEQISYSNHGMSLAAFAVEHNRGRSFAELATNNVFGPLGMHSTGFLTRGQKIPSESAVPLSCEKGICERVPHLFSHAYPAGLAFSTARDMSRFIAAMLEADENESPLAELIPTRFTNDKRIPGMSYGFFNQNHNGFRFLAHAGAVPGYRSLLLISPKADLGFFFVINGGSSRFGERFRDEILRAFLGEETVTPPSHSSSEDPSIRAGIYESTRYSHETIERFPQVFHESITVIAEGDTLKIFSGGRTNKYLQTGNALYENIDGSDRIAFGVRRGQPRLFRSSTAFGAAAPFSYEKRPWYHAPRFLNEYVSWLFALPFLILFLLWPIIAGISRFLRKRSGREKHPQSLISVGATAVTALSVGLFATFGFLFIGKSNRLLESGELFFGMPETLIQFAWIPAVDVILVVLVCASFILAWKNSWWDLARRLLFTILTISLVLQIAFLVQWNYLPMSW